MAALAVFFIGAAGVLFITDRIGAVRIGFIAATMLCHQVGGAEIVRLCSPHLRGPGGGDLPAGRGRTRPAGEPRMEIEWSVVEDPTFG